MEHLLVYLFILSVLVISIEYNVVRIDLILLRRYWGNIIGKIVGILLAAIITSWLK
jgi:hypothetical protein